MIPKIIHSCWFGRGKKNDLFAECVDNQARFCVNNGWFFHETNEDTLDPELMNTPFMRGVLERGEWTKATVVGRYSALARFGGVYLDCDVEIMRPFYDLMDCALFAGWEDGSFVCDAVIGSVPACNRRGYTIAKLLHGLSFYSGGNLGAHEYGPSYLTSTVRNLNDVALMGPDAFYPVHYSKAKEMTAEQKRQIAREKNSIVLHHYAFSWEGL